MDKYTCYKFAVGISIDKMLSFTKISSWKESTVCCCTLTVHAVRTCAEEDWEWPGFILIRCVCLIHLVCFPGFIFCFESNCYLLAEETYLCIYRIATGGDWKCI